MSRILHFVLMSALAPLLMLCFAEFGSNLLLFEQLVDLPLSNQFDRLLNCDELTLESQFAIGHLLSLLAYDLLLERSLLLLLPEATNLLISDAVESVVCGGRRGQYRRLVGLLCELGADGLEVLGRVVEMLPVVVFLRELGR